MAACLFMPLGDRLLCLLPALPCLLCCCSFSCSAVKTICLALKARGSNNVWHSAPSSTANVGSSCFPPLALLCLSFPSCCSACSPGVAEPLVIVCCASWGSYLLLFLLLLLVLLLPAAGVVFPPIIAASTLCRIVPAARHCSRWLVTGYKQAAVSSCQRRVSGPTA